ncbi:MAG: hypothetical protein ACRC1Z_24945 [Waterburya sp.]
MSQESPSKATLGAYWRECQQFISDIYNQDLEIDLDRELKPALEILADYFKEYWLIQILY